MSSARSLTPYRRFAAMSLLELLAAVAIVAILAAVAIPAYRLYLQRAHRTEAKAALLRAAANQERFYLRHKTYTTDLTQLGFARADQAATEHGRYTLTVRVADGETFTIQANAAGAMLADENCRQFTIDAQGLRRAAPDPAGTCW